MKIAVTDANIFIDLIKLQLLGHLFSIDIEIYSTREVVDQLNDAQYEKLELLIQSNNLNVYHFTGEELSAINDLPCPNALEFPDRTVVYLAQKITAEVLTGDGPLKRFCTDRGLTVHGIIWLFDVFLAKELIKPALAVQKLNELLNFNSRLLKDECINRLKLWEAM